MHVNTINSHRIDFFLSEINPPLTYNIIPPKKTSIPTLQTLYRPLFSLLLYIYYSYSCLIQYFSTTNSKYIF